MATVPAARPRMVPQRDLARVARLQWWDPSLMDIKEVELPSKATKSVLRQWVSPSTENKNTTFGREPKEKEFNRKKTQGPL